mmetsp:Transcript_5730/g.14597  ORF Transcript_5730/g.14597 Transcript_5730/m.14597 type:complete len:264 (-) Transcript_5730:1970-2761(-)
MLTMDASLATQTHLLILLLRQLLLVHLLEFLDLAVGVLLQLRQHLLVLLEGSLLLADDAVLRLSVLALELLKVETHLIDDTLMLLEHGGVLHLPLLLLPLQVLGQLLIPLHLNQHLLLEGLLQVLRGLAVLLLELTNAVLILDLHLVLLLSQYLKLAPLRLDLFAVLLLQLGHLLLVVAVAMPELELDFAGELLHLALEVQQRGLLVVQEGPSYQDLIGEAQSTVFVALAWCLPLHFEDVKAAVLASAEEALVVEGDPDARDR